MTGKILRTLCFALVAWGWGASAQDYPARPVKIVVPYAAGGVPDVIARIVGQRLSESFSHQFLIENRGGAGGISAVMSVVKAPADGYTVLMADVAHTALNTYLFTNLPYDVLKDLQPVSVVANSAPFIVVNPSLPIGSFSEFLAYAKAHPGKLSYGSGGIGSVLHISMEVIKASQGIDLVHVPYKGSGQSVPAFLAGEVQVVVTALTALGPHVKSGKAKLLAVTSAHRSRQAPDVPSVSEFIPGYDFEAEIGLLVPAGTPAAVVARLSAEVAKAVKHPETMARLTTLGLDPVGSTPEAYATAIRRNLERFAEPVRQSGAKVN